MTSLTAVVLSVNVGEPRTVEWRGRSVTSAIWKHPVDGPVTIAGVNLDGDDQADRRVHGGADKAVYSYSTEHYAWWSTQVGALAPGTFGENLTTEGLPVSTAVVGELWHVGDAGLVLSPTLSRIPCATFQARMGERQWTKRFSQANRTGAYLRVVSPGDVRSGDAIVVTDVPAHGVTIADSFHAYMHDHIEVEELIARRMTSA